MSILFLYPSGEKKWWVFLWMLYILPLHRKFLCTLLGIYRRLSEIEALDLALLIWFGWFVYTH